MPRYELTEELQEKLGKGRESLACIHARHILTGLPHTECVPEAKLPKDFDWRKDMTVWELEIGSRLADHLRPEYMREQRILRAAAKVRRKEGSTTTLSEEDKQKALEKAKGK